MPPTIKLTQSGGRRAQAATPAPAPVRRISAGAPILLVDDEAFGAALDALDLLDGTFMATMRAAGDLPRLRRREAGFRGLAAIIVSQQVSTASANAIFARLEARFPHLHATALLAASDEELRSCGLSAGKARTLRAIAQAELDGVLDFATMVTADADSSHATLCTIKGIGPWTADIFLLFCLGHADAWPVGDLAVQEGARLALGLDARPDAKALEVLGERWRPLRGVVAHCLWAYYTLKRARPATLDATPPAGTSPPHSKKRIP